MHLPLLPLETYRPRWSEPGPHAVLERERVLAASGAALQAGVRPGMKRNGALALCPDTRFYERDAQRERQAIDSIALCLLQYTPEVALAALHNLMMDISASLRAFGGLRRLFRLVEKDVRELGFTARLALAPTAQGAWLLAQATGAAIRRRRAVKLATLMHRLDRIPCHFLPALEPYADWIAGIGCRTLGDVRRLPRAGLKRRCNEAVLDALDRAYGEAPEMFNWIVAPEVFSTRLELPDRIEHAEALLFGARRLLLQMTGWLAARQLAVERLVLALEHERGRQAIPPTLLELALAEATWQEAHVTRLLKERLGRIELAAPVIALRLEATHTTAMAAPSGSLFPEPGGTPADFARLVELLSARLGSDNVLMPALHADHRPEACNRWQPAGLAATAISASLKGTESRGRRAHRDDMVRAAHPTSPSQIEIRSKQPELPAYERPFWLLASPVELMLREHRPFYGSPLRLAGSPERIECGWWDGRLVVRDYFIAQGADQAWYWIYRERQGDDIRWYLHGLFG